ncbi:MAG TPA: hypothetical protein VKT75_19365 [Acidobacteriaceae bacterium]|nr:hypothetical protein [Acidobacteriaceae bacterium]
MKTQGNGTALDTHPPRHRVLVVTMLEGIDTKVAEIAVHLAMSIEIAGGRSAALHMLERKSYSVVVLDQMLAETDPEGADLLWRHCGFAVPLQFSLSIAGSARLERELRMALARREREQELARLAAAAEIDAEIKNAVTAFLLESQLALAEAGMPLAIEGRLQNMAEIASRLRADLRKSAATSPVRGIERSNSPK